MMLELPTGDAKILEQIRRSLRTTREEAIRLALNAFLDDLNANKLLAARNPVTEQMSEDEVYEIANAAVKQARLEKRRR